MFRDCYCVCFRRFLGLYDFLNKVDLYNTCYNYQPYNTYNEI